VSTRRRNAARRIAGVPTRERRPSQSMSGSSRVPFGAAAERAQERQAPHPRRRRERQRLRDQPAHRVPDDVARSIRSASRIASASLGHRLDRQRSARLQLAVADAGIVEDDQGMPAAERVRPAGAQARPATPQPWIRSAGGPAPSRVYAIVPEPVWNALHDADPPVCTLRAAERERIPAALRRSAGAAAAPRRSPPRPGGYG
jgi:hypothetical protein